MSSARAYTADEVREKFLAHLHALVDYWSTETRVSDPKEKMEGLVHSILVTLDGCSGDMPSFSLVVQPHPDDEQFHRDLDENWYPNGLAIEGTAMFHEEWSR